MSQVEQPFSLSAMLKMSAARAVSREENDILRIASMMGRASNDVMSTVLDGFAEQLGLGVVAFLRDSFHRRGFGGGGFVCHRDMTPEERTSEGRRPALGSGFA